MWVSGLKLTGIRCFKNEELNFSRGVNIIVGQNNSGKSSILKAIHTLQDGCVPLNDTDKRKATQQGIVEIKLKGEKSLFASFLGSAEFDRLTYDIKNPRMKTFFRGSGSRSSQSLIPQVEPSNFIYPYFSSRKVVAYNEQINAQHTNSVPGNFQNLYPKIDRIANPANEEAYDYFVKACDEILGFRVSCVASSGGKKAAYIYNNFESIPVDKMGEGVINILGLIVDLCVAKNKLFLIEEPENDIHPKALKALLGLIAEKAKDNQFIVTTHSNIVLKTLGSVDDSAVFSINMEFEDKVPTSKVVRIGQSPSERKEILEDLGYELYDFDLWAGWLFLEESSAERIIRDYLIPWFVKPLKEKLRTFSSRSLSEVRIKFEDFNRLFVYLHLEPTYKDRVWVLIDGGDEEKEILEELRTAYSKSGWNEEQFLQLSEHDFENYYPKRFAGEVSEVLGIDNKKQKRLKKKELLDKVILWCDEEPDAAKIEFKESAAEVLTVLRKINRCL